MSSPNFPKPVACPYNETALFAPPSVMGMPPKLEYSVDGYPEKARAYVIGPEDPNDVDEILLGLHGWRSDAKHLAWLGAELVDGNPNRAVVLPEQPRTFRPAGRLSLPRYLKQEGNTHIIGERRTRSAMAAGVAACELFPEAGGKLKMFGHSLGVVDAVNAALKLTEVSVQSVTAYAGAGLFSKNITQGIRRRCTREALRKFHNEPLQVMTEARYAFQQDISYKLMSLIEREVELYSVEFEKDDLFQPNSRRSLFFPNGHTLIKADYDTGSCACHCAPTHPHEAKRMAEIYDDMHVGKYIGHKALAAYHVSAAENARMTATYGLQTV